MPDDDSHDDDRPHDIHRSLAELYRVHRPSLVRSVRPMVDSVDAAEEVVQEVFARLLRAEILPERNAPAYLHTAARNEARSELRRRAVVRRHHDELVNDQLIHAEPLLGEQVASRLDAEALTPLLQQLASRQRDVVELRYARGLPERVVAAQLGITAGSVKTHASRGLRTLRQRLAEIDEAAIA